MSQYTHLITEKTSGPENFVRIATIFGLDYRTPIMRSAPPPPAALPPSAVPLTRCAGRGNMAAGPRKFVRMCVYKRSDLNVALQAPPPPPPSSRQAEPEVDTEPEDDEED